MLLYEFTGLTPDPSFQFALEAGGVPTGGWGITTRRYDGDGNVTAVNQPPAIILPQADGSHLATVHALYLAHVPFHGHVANRKAAVRRHARLLIDRYVDSVDLTEVMMFMLHVLWKLSQSQSLTAAETNRLPAAAQIRNDVMAIRSAAQTIIAELNGMTDAEAGAVDVENHPAWPSP